MEENKKTLSSEYMLEKLEQHEEVIEISDGSDDECDEKFTSSVVIKKFKSDGLNLKEVKVEAILTNIADLNFGLSKQWKIRGRVTFQSNIREFHGRNGLTEVISFDIQDQTGEICVVAFDLLSQHVQNHIEMGKCYEIDGLMIRSIDDVYKTLPIAFQVQVTHDTNINLIEELPRIIETYSYIQLSQLETVPINSVVDIQARVIRDYGLVGGITKEKQWLKREIHIREGTSQTRLTLWNEQAKQFNKSMILNGLRLKHVKVKWFDGRKCLQTMDNTRMASFEWCDDFCNRTVQCFDRNG